MQFLPLHLLLTPPSRSVPMTLEVMVVFFFDVFLLVGPFLLPSTPFCNNKKRAVALFPPDSQED